MKTDYAAQADKLHEWMLRHSGAYAPKLTAAEIDRRADIELQAGRHSVAERLAHAAAAMREGAR